MKKLLYIGHAFHNKTKSSTYIQDLLSSHYDMEKFDFDPYSDDDSVFEKLAGKSYDVVVLLQIMPSIKMLDKYIKYKHINYFPMYDQVQDVDLPIWSEYKNVNIIIFSKTLYKKCKDAGLSSYHIQYFPEPGEIKNLGDEKSAFLWERINCINIHTIDKTIGTQNLDRICIHRVPDPGNKLTAIPEHLKDKVKVSTWFDTKEEMLEYIQESAIYYAPRKYEGIGMSFLEAMALGRCVVAPDNATMNEYIQHGYNGYLYDLNNPSEIKIENIREIQQNSARFIEEGRKNWQQNKSKIIEWLETDPSENYNLELMNEKLLTQEQYKKLYKWKNYSIWERIFSIKNVNDGKMKTITILGVRITFKRKKK